jgi:hypothetical protein
MLVALGLVAVGALLLWFFVLQDDRPADVGPKQDAGDLIEIRIDVSPRFAQVNVDGVALTRNPLVLPRSKRQYMVTVRAKGYWTQTVSFTPDKARAFFIELKLRGAK